jgi:hypothetical protein
MFLRLALLAGCAALFLIAAVPTGSLYITTLPTGADVWLDGMYIGHSPVFLDALSIGRHTISLNRTGWISQDLDVSVVAGTTALSSVALARTRTLLGGGGSLTVKGIALRSLALDGTIVMPDRNGTYSVASGTHEIVAQTAGGKMTRTVTVYPDMRTDVVLRDDDPATHSAVVAPASDYLPAAAVKIEGTRVTIRYEHHDVEATVGAVAYRVDGRSVSFDAAPTLIGAALYLPLELLKELTANDDKAK